MEPLVYVVDDEAIVRGLVGRFLQKAGYDSEAFESAEAFFQRA